MASEVVWCHHIEGRGDRDGGVVDEDIEAAECRQCRCNHSGCAVSAGDGMRVGNGATTRRPYFVEDRLSTRAPDVARCFRVMTDVVTYNVSAPSCQSQCIPKPEAGPATRTG